MYAHIIICQTKYKSSGIITTTRGRQIIVCSAVLWTGSGFRFPVNLLVQVDQYLLHQNPLILRFIACLEPDVLLWHNTGPNTAGLLWDKMRRCALEGANECLLLIRLQSNQPKWLVRLEAWLVLCLSHLFHRKRATRMIMNNNSIS